MEKLSIDLESNAVKAVFDNYIKDNDFKGFAQQILGQSTYQREKEIIV